MWFEFALSEKKETEKRKGEEIKKKTLKKRSTLTQLIYMEGGGVRKFSC